MRAVCALLSASTESFSPGAGPGDSLLAPPLYQTTCPPSLYQVRSVRSALSVGACCAWGNVLAFATGSGDDAWLLVVGAVFVGVAVAAVVGMLGLNMRLEVTFSVN